MEPYALLIVARTQSLAKRLRASLDAEQYVVRWAPSSAQALGYDLHPSLLVLELPPSGGARTVAWLKRRFEAPVVAILHAGQSAPEQVEAFLFYPYQTNDLVDLIETTLLSQSSHLIHAANMRLDTETRRLQMDGSLHQLRPIGCRILAILMARAGQIVPRDELFRRVWHTEDVDNTRALDVHIAALRCELEADPRHPELIVTERGVGYRLRPPE
jgi:two-component system KDP operon response regulator KdpE